MKKVGFFTALVLLTSLSVFSASYQNVYHLYEEPLTVSVYDVKEFKLIRDEQSREHVIKLKVVFAKGGGREHNYTSDPIRDLSWEYKPCSHNSGKVFLEKNGRKIQFAEFRGDEIKIKRKDGFRLECYKKTFNEGDYSVDVVFLDLLAGSSDQNF